MVSVSENLVLEKKSRFQFEKFGIGIKVSVSVSVKILVLSFSGPDHPGVGNSLTNEGLTTTPPLTHMHCSNKTSCTSHKLIYPEKVFALKVSELRVHNISGWNASCFMCGGGGHFNPKIYVADFGPLNRAF